MHVESGFSGYAVDPEGLGDLLYEGARIRLGRTEVCESR
jgi:hypothetical protein